MHLPWAFLTYSFLVVYERQPELNILDGACRNDDKNCSQSEWQNLL